MSTTPTHAAAWTEPKDCGTQRLDDRGRVNLWKVLKHRGLWPVKNLGMQIHVDSAGIITLTPVAYMPIDEWRDLMKELK